MLFIYMPPVQLDVKDESPVPFGHMVKPLITGEEYAGELQSTQHVLNVIPIVVRPRDYDFIPAIFKFIEFEESFYKTANRLVE